MKDEQLRKMERKELDSKLKELRKEMIKHSAQLSSKTGSKAIGQIQRIKKTIARIKTIINERATQAALAKLRTEESKKDE